MSKAGKKQKNCCKRHFEGHRRRFKRKNRENPNDWGILGAGRAKNGASRFINDPMQGGDDDRRENDHTSRVDEPHANVLGQREAEVQWPRVPGERSKEKGRG